MKNTYNVDEIFYYYMRDKNSRPVITICIASFNGKYARGISICSPFEMPIKKEGRKIARKRALKAMFNEYTGDEINRTEACLAISYLYKNKNQKYIFDFEFKSEYEPELTGFEKLFVGLIERNMN